MTDELHNHIAAMVCETDAPGKPADVTPGEIERSIWSAMIWAANQPPPPHGAAHPSYTDSGNSDAETECRRAASRIRAALAEQTARAEAAEARVAELTAKLEAPVQVGVKPLEWRTVAPYGLHEAYGLCWKYQIREGTDGIIRWQSGHMGAWFEAATVEAAKAAAQADYEARILALIPTPAPSPDVPTPPDGWNVMKLGQVGWHVVQSANGWETSRIFGAECLLRSGGGDEFGPALDATPDGGRVAADAPTPSPDVGALAEAAKGLAYAGDILRAWDAENIQHQGAGRVAEVMADVANRCDLLRAALAKLKDGDARAFAAQEGGE